jgi:UDP-N-acetylmuramoyl-L-alanyl-D-glutamate--2,6-diaminopimelate ligase
MNLNALLAGFTSQPLPDLNLTGLALDSRDIKHAYGFIALAGAKQHGLSHLNQAIANGASVVLYDANTIDAPACAIPLIAIANLSQKLGEIAARFYHNPSQTLEVIGITGTNGKTSCSQFLAQTLSDCGIIGTLGWGQYGALHKTLNTTPDALAVQSMLASLRDSGQTRMAMEVSSHGLHQGRVNGVRFKGAVFTNISRDHLDYHGDMSDYINAKCLLLQSPNLEFAVINLDDAYSQHIIAQLPASVVLWGVSRQGKTAPFGETLNANHCQHSNDGLHFELSWREHRYSIQSPLYGDFNIDNLLCVLAVLLALEISPEQAQTKLAQLNAVQGRMERFGGGQQPLIFIDYAHTPDALEKVLSSLRAHCAGRLWVVFGCGGNRDTGKRPLMGAIAERLADKVIITDDNPRDESSLDIMNAIIAGLVNPENVQLIANRKLAIESAIRQANSDDCLVIAGKGHEDYQEINAIRTPFSDSAVVIAELGNN